MAEHLLKWSDEFRPPIVDRCILPDVILAQAKNIISNGADIPDLFFFGPPGTGKTTLGKAIIHELGADAIFYNGSSGTLNMEALREELEMFGNTSSLCINHKNSKTNLKFVFIDEADGLRPEIQRALRSAMEDYPRVRYILTANYPNLIIPALHSRGGTIDFNFNKKDRQALVGKFAHRCVEILNAKGVTYENNALISVISKFYPDNRQILNTLQFYSNLNKHIDGGIVENLNVQYDELFDAMFELDIMAVRQWVTNNATSNIYNLLWRESEHRIPVDVMPNWILALGEGQKDDGSTPSLDLSVTCALTQFMSGIPKGYKYVRPN